MRRFVSSAALVIAILVGVVPRAAASRPVTATGAFTFVSDTQTPIGAASGDTYSDEVAAVSYKGALTGIALDTDTFVTHKDGSFTAQGSEVCAACTIGGKTGTFISLFMFAGSGTTYRGALIFTRATGGLAGLHGGGAFQGNTAGNTYSYAYWFGRKG